MNKLAFLGYCEKWRKNQFTDMKVEVGEKI